jgi:SpoVK/Ycf46/Vps4 family AAA+-type ATPase
MEAKANSSKDSKQKGSGTAANTGQISKKVIRKHYGNVPIAIYRIKDHFIKTVTVSSFRDAMLVSIAFLAAISALNFYPSPIAMVLLLALFFAALLTPFLGVALLFIFLFPIFMYQTPVLSWMFLMVGAASFVVAYKYYRAVVFIFVLTLPALSVFGYIFEIPLFIFTVLTIGAKRAAAAFLVAAILIIAFSGVTGIQNSAFIIYNAPLAHTIFTGTQFAALDTPNKIGFTLLQFPAGVASTFGTFFSFNVAGQIPGAIGAILATFTVQPERYLLQIVVLVILIFLIEGYAIGSRSKFRGTIASLIGIGYPLSYMALSYYFGSPVVLTPLLSFIIAPAVFFVLEDNDIMLVKALEVRKSDIRMKFGEAFEDLEAGNVNETFKNIGNYDATKEELREAIISPMEERGVARAYNITPTKGILFFGPPGTGKTMMMRALANEIHGGFFYVKASNIISAFPGETEKIIEKVFGIARRNTPCILFFDEIDAIALNRETGGADDSHRQALSQLLTEMDGFQKINNVIIVGATNRPDLMDKALLRPGRFDKLIYMPLPDAPGRAAIFKIYLSKLPVADDINMKKLVDKTERYSGADIMALCEGVAQSIAQEAVKEHTVLEITNDDILHAITTSKPSTSLSQIDEYQKFKLDFERSIFKNISSNEDKSGIKLADVIGDEEAKKAIKEAVEIPLLYPELMKKYNIKPINGVLFFGPPGTGKTMLMRAVNNEIKGVTMIELSGSTLLEEGVDSALSKLKETFNRARENAPSVVFIDEIDGIFPSRENASEFGVQVTTQALKETDATRAISNVVIIGTSNRPDILDPAIIRPGRFDKLVYVGPPNVDSRTKMFKAFLAATPISDKVDYKRLADLTKDFTGADIVNLCDTCKRRALEQEVSTGKSIELDGRGIEEIIKTKKPSVTKQDIKRYLDFIAKYGER